MTVRYQIQKAPSIPNQVFIRIFLLLKFRDFTTVHCSLA
jgi:hypothetical protein